MISSRDSERSLAAQVAPAVPRVELVEALLVEKLADRLDVAASEIDVDAYFDEFDVDPSEAPALVGNVATRLGLELDRAALWHHPTIASLAQHLADELAGRATREAARDVRARAA